MTKVAEVMTQAVLTLSPMTSLVDAAQTLATLGVSGAPVCDVEGHVLGVFSKSDVVDRLSGGRLDEAGTVGEHMTRRVVSVGPTAPLSEAIALMATKAVHRIVVVDGEGRVVGIVTPLDIVKAVADGRSLLGSLDACGARVGTNPP